MSIKNEEDKFKTQDPSSETISACTHIKSTQT